MVLYSAILLYAFRALPPVDAGGAFMEFYEVWT